MRANEQGGKNNTDEENEAEPGFRLGVLPSLFVASREEVADADADAGFVRPGGGRIRDVAGARTSESGSLGQSLATLALRGFGPGGQEGGEWPLAMTGLPSPPPPWTPGSVRSQPGGESRFSR